MSRHKNKEWMLGKQVVALKMSMSQIKTFLLVEHASLLVIQIIRGKFGHLGARRPVGYLSSRPPEVGTRAFEDSSRPR